MLDVPREQNNKIGAYFAKTLFRNDRNPAAWHEPSLLCGIAIDDPRNEISIYSCVIEKRVRFRCRAISDNLLPRSIHICQQRQKSITDVVDALLKTRIKFARPNACQLLGLE